MVIEHKACTLDYLLDNMQMYELNTLLSNVHYSSKESWEQTRMLAYIIAQVNSRKQLKPSDILKFNWDETQNIDSEDEGKITQEDVEKFLKIKNQSK